MSHYKFSLQSVLEWRNDQEEAAKMELGQAQDRLAKENQLLNQLLHESIRLKERLIQTTKIDQMRQQDLYRALLDDKIVKQKLALEQAQNELQLANENLLKAHQNRKVMEKLDEKEFERHKEEVKNEEQKQIDEFSTITFGREMY